MKLAAKLILIFMLGVLAIVSLFAWQTIRRQQAWEEQQRNAHAGNLVETLSPAIKKAYQEGGTITIEKAVEISTRHLSGPKVRWIDGDEAPSGQTQTTSRQTTSLSITDANGNRRAYSYVPMTIGDNQSGALEVAEPLDKQDAFTRGSVMTSILSLLGVAAFSGLVIYFGGVQLVGKPLNRLIAQVNEIGDGHLEQAPALNSNDELGRLATAISEMSHRLGHQRDAIRHSDRLGTVGTLAAGLAHELGTPLNVVSGRAGLIASGKLSDAEVEASAKTIKSEADRMTGIIRQLLDFARQAPSPHSEIELRGVISRTLDLMGPLAEKAHVHLESEMTEEPISIDGDAAQIQQVLTNLISNAISSMPDGGTVRVSLDKTPDQNVCIQISDTGIGMNVDEVSHVFEPFYTTKDVGQGTGLGLSIAYGIVRDHGGEIKVESHVGIGTTFSVIIPIHKNSTA